MSNNTTTRRVALFGSLFLLLSLPAHPSDPPAEPRTDTTIHFEFNECGAPYVNATVNGEKANLVIDSGSTVTYFDTSYKKHIGSHDAAVVIDALFKVTLKAPLIPQNFKRLKREGAECGTTGVIGNDILTSCNAIIDYAHMTIVLRGGK